jgi:hypothetical protein
MIVLKVAELKLTVIPACFAADAKAAISSVTVESPDAYWRLRFSARPLATLAPQSVAVVPGLSQVMTPLTIFYPCETRRFLASETE